MNRHNPIAIVVIAACALVVWALRSGTFRPPGTGAGDGFSVTVHPKPDGSKPGAARREDPGANGYGSITGQVVLVGEIPVLPVLVRTGDNRIKPEDRATCAREDILDESLLIDEKTRGIANVFVYLPQATRGIHPSLQKSDERLVECEIKGCRCAPRALFARTDQLVVVRIQDDVPHNLHDRPLRAARFGQTIKPLNQQRDMEFEYARPEPFPFPVVCDLHPWMHSSWLILDHPYAAITDTQGKFTVADLPVGNYEFQVWHEKTGKLPRDLKVTVNSDQTTEIGEIPLPLERFEDRARVD